jgi:hypothetical protein
VVDPGRVEPVRRRAGVGIARIGVQRFIRLVVWPAVAVAGADEPESRGVPAATRATCSFSRSFSGFLQLQHWTGWVA